MTISQWIRTHVWPYTAIRKAYQQGFTKGVKVGGDIVSAHIQSLAQQACMDEENRTLQADLAERRQRASQN